MSREAPDWAQVGAVMVQRFGSSWGRVYGDKTTKITARLKNGNVRLDGSDSQWRCDTSGRVTEAGATGYHKPSYVLLTPEVQAEAEREKQVEIAKRKVRIEAERLENIWRHAADDTILAAAAAIQEPTP